MCRKSILTVLMILCLVGIASAEIQVAGELLVDISATDPSAGTAIWVNNGTLGDFTRFMDVNDIPEGSSSGLIPAPNDMTVGAYEGVPVVFIASEKDSLQAYTGPIAPATITGMDDRSIEIWAADLNGELQKDKCLIAWGGRKTGENFSVNLGYKSFGALGLYGDDFDTEFGAPQPSAQTLHHLVYVIDSNNTATIYVDGVLSTVRSFSTDDGSDGILKTTADSPMNLFIQNSKKDDPLPPFVLSSSGLPNDHALNSIRVHSGELTAEQVLNNFEAGPAKTAVLITKSVDLSLGFDQQIADRLASLGYTVMAITGSDVKNEVFTVADAEAVNVIVVSESIGSSDVVKLAGANVPMMNGEGYGWHKMYYAEDGTQGWQDANSLADIVNDTHPIVVDANLALGTVEFLLDEKATTTTQQVSYLAPGAVSLVSMVHDGNDYALVFAIDKGAQLAKDPNMTAANRIVGFSLPGNQVGVLSDFGWALFDAAIRWMDPAHAPVPPMAAYWPLDDSADDVVGGNNGTIVGDVNFVDGGARFDVSDPNCGITVADSAELDFNDVDFSISMMVRYLVTPGSGEHQLMCKGTFGSPDSGSRYVIFHKGTAMRFDIDNGPANAKSGVSVSDAPFLTGEWVQLVVIRDATNDLISLYADGVLLGTATDNSGAIASGEAMAIGNSPLNGRTCEADLSDVRIFPSALTDAQIRTIGMH